jgi:hypothetical protein
MTSHTAIGLFNGNIWLLGVQDEDSCGTDLTEITWLDRATGVVLDSFRFGGPNCTNGINTDLHKIYSTRTDKVVLTGVISNCPTCAKIRGVVEFNETSFDTVSRYWIAVTGIDFIQDDRFAILQQNCLVVTGANYDTLHLLPNIPNGTAVVKFDSLSAKLYATTRVVMPSGQHAMQLIVTDSTLSNPYFDTIEIRPGQSEIPQFLTKSAVPNEYVLISRTSNIATDISVFNSVTGQKTHTALPFHNFNQAVSNLTNSSVYVACHTGVNTIYGDHVVYKFDVFSNTVTDSVRLPFGVAPNLQMDFSSDGYLFIVQNRLINSISDFVVYQLNAQLQVISIISIPDSIIQGAAYVRDAVAGTNGELYFIVAGLQPYHSVIYKVQMSPTGVVSNPTSYCTYIGAYTTPSSYQITFEPGCRPQRIQMYNALGQTIVTSEFNSGTVMLQAPATGIYIIQVLFENGEVKREKVFLTAN